jgi:hypothetical protein
MKTVVLEYVVVATGEVLDTITIEPGVEAVYATGVARAQLNTLRGRIENISALVSWTNGYVAFRPAGRSPSRP